MKKEFVCRNGRRKVYWNINLFEHVHAPIKYVCSRTNPKRLPPNMHIEK